MHNSSFNVTLGEIADEFKLKEINKTENMRDVLVYNNEVNRCGLALAGYFDHFEHTRLQIIGHVEATYINTISDEQKKSVFEKMFSLKIPAIILSNGIELPQSIIDLSEKYGVPVLSSTLSTSRFTSALIAYLNVMLAERETRHGVLVEVYGEGILLLADSGVGKSETAIELVKRGHRLVADDAVEIKKVSDKSLVGSAPEIIRHFIELRGIGIIDVKQIFGMGAVKDTEKIDMVIHLENWQQHKQYDRLGLTTEYTNILDIDIPSVTIPVKPGRNLAVIVEVAAMNNRQRKMGYNAAQALNERILGNTNAKNNL